MQSDDLGLVARLQPRHMADEPLARAVVSEDQTERRAAVSAFLAANNALKREAAAAIERLADARTALCVDLNVTDEELLRIRNTGEMKSDGNVKIWGKMLLKIVDAVRHARQALKDAP